jgi:hypothetical protein
MTPDHLTALLSAADAKKTDDGWVALPEGRGLTLYVGLNGATLTVQRIQTLKIEGPLLHARTNKSEHFVLALTDAYAGSVDAPSGVSKKAGFL